MRRYGNVSNHKKRGGGRFVQRYKNDTSWQKVAHWYNKITESGKGHYYHRHIVIPGVLRLLDLTPTDNITYSAFKILDLACGNGVLAKNLQSGIKYLGIDLSAKLISFAQSEDKNPLHSYMIADVSRPLTIPVNFTHSTIILALQNIKNPSGVIGNASRHMARGGKLIIVLNHPMFRIPRQTSWGLDTDKKIQYRRIDAYMSHLSIPINMNPGNPKSEMTISYHYTLSAYSRMLKEAGFLIESIEEWTSDKNSTGKTGKMENRARAEIPLFMAIAAIKK